MSNFGGSEMFYALLSEKKPHMYGHFKARGGVRTSIFTFDMLKLYKNAAHNFLRNHKIRVRY